ncbi:MAG: acylphosphatase [Bacteroidota bacterium]
MITSIRINVSGTLWKRGFRFYSMQKAVEYGICGTVAYGESHNEIIIHAEGDETAIEKFLHWCSIGSPSCRIKKIETEPVSLMNYKTFDILEN